MSDHSTAGAKIFTRAQEIFKSAKPEYQTLIREALKEERNVMHLRRRSDIHQRLYDHVKRVIK
ncbi:MAG: hypothetical protein RKO24_06875 [Candidatus Competibacter sp.]|nr:hypothetical protein [Candidatus Competibacter sp.]